MQTETTHRSTALATKTEAQRRTAGGGDSVTTLGTRAASENGLKILVILANRKADNRFKTHIISSTTHSQI